MATDAQLAEKALQDRLGVRTPSPAALEPPRRGRPPPLPPRENSISSPPAYSAEDAKRSEMISVAWRSHDPRSSSTHSLVPSESGRGRDGRRKLLAVFIHGFMGNETSFQSFPAHLHNLLTVALSETHVVHTKIYPRYKSRRAIDFARDDFGTWLEPHEDDATDVILLGHSMGGILSAEVALQPPPSPATGQPFAHRILGTISFDTPFLGMHPGVIASGIGSLFRPAPDPPGSKPAQATSSGASSPSLETQASASMYSQGTSTPTTYGGDSETSSQISRLTALSNPPPDDPNFNPTFSNDVRLSERKGLNSVLHFINKHAEGLTTANKFAALTGATKSYFMSHLEFGGCLADYPGMKARYTKLRALEDVDDAAQRPSAGYRPSTRRIRFVNYYTASTGRPKEPKIPSGQMMDKDGNLKPMEEEMKDMSLETTNSHTPTPTPSISIEQVDGDGDATPERMENAMNDAPLEIQMQDLGENSGVHDEVQEPAPMRHIDSMPIEDEEEMAALPSIEPAGDETSAPKFEPITTEPPLPPIPEKPTEPEPIDLTIYTDKDSRKIAEKEHKRITKAYQQAVKDRESTIKDRKKLVEKREKKARQEAEKQLKAEQKQRAKEEKEEAKRLATINPEPAPSATSPSGTRAGSVSVQDNKPKRDKKFCMLPPETNGKRDKCWVRVYMEGVDEVGAHCGLFFPGPQYESLVGNVGERIEEWVKEDGAKRALRDAH